MNIYEMYYDNKKSVDFWISRNSWGKTVARVVDISGIESGSLKGVGRYPYFNDANVHAEIYKITYIDDEMVLEQIKPMYGYVSADNKNLATISCPGTYSYTRVFPRRGYFKVKLIGIDEILKINVEQEEEIK